eukprot:2779215-Karenia_brevis.AAC.1
MVKMVKVVKVVKMVKVVKVQAKAATADPNMGLRKLPPGQNDCLDLKMNSETQNDTRMTPTR